MRIALVLEYDGSSYHGWQSQTGLYTVQGELEHALSLVADHSISVVCAGRTDTGVHALHQVVHFDTDRDRSLRAWVYGTNSFLSKNISVQWASLVDETFHARYSALSRRYRYVIYNASIRPALMRSQVTWQYQPLNHDLMHEAAQCLLGENDYTSFRSIECQSRTAMRHIHEIKVSRESSMIYIDIVANAFLHHMVRNIVGVLTMVGMEKRPAEWVKEVLHAKDRRTGAVTAPPYGLYLVDVSYPESFTLKHPNHLTISV